MRSRTRIGQQAARRPARNEAAEDFSRGAGRIVIQPVREYLSEVAKENQQLEETRNVLEETNSTIDGALGRVARTGGAGPS